MILSTLIAVSVQSMTVGDTQQSVHDLLTKADSELVQMYGTPASMKMLVNGDVERTWSIGSGTLHVTHTETGKVADVKFFMNITAGELETMTKLTQA